MRTVTFHPLPTPNPHPVLLNQISSERRFKEVPSSWIYTSFQSSNFPGITLSNKPWDPFRERFFHRISNSMTNWFLCKLFARYHIATNFYTWHDSTAVVRCAKCHSDHFTTIRMRAEWISHRMEKSVVKWVCVWVQPRLNKCTSHEPMNTWSHESAPLNRLKSCAM